MNANEHLDFYNPDSIYYGNSHHYIQQLEAMLRQQQAEIEELKQIIDANNLNQNIGQFVKPTNEPVAWIDKSKLDDWLHGDCYPDQCFIHYQTNDAIPLYTHPVKEQDESFDRTASHMAGEYVSYKAELTDDEILGVWQEKSSSGELYYDLLEFARAILRKAQEK